MGRGLGSSNGRPPSFRHEEAICGMKATLLQTIRSHSFRYKLMAAAIVCVLIPAVATMIVSGYMTRDAVKEQAVENGQQSLQLVDGYVTSLFKSMLYVANYIHLDTDIKAILQERASGNLYTGPDQGYKDFYDRKSIATKIDNLSIAGEKFYVTILLPNGEFYANYAQADFNPQELLQAPWFGQLQQIQSLETLWVGTEPTGNRVDRAAHPYQISIARTIRSDANQIIGYTIITVFEDQVKELLLKLTSHQEIMLLDREGMILSHKDPARIGTPFPMEVTAGGPDIVEIDGEQFLVSEDTLDIAASGWKLIMLTPYQEAVAKINRIFDRVFIIQMLAFAVFLVLLVYLIRTFTQPLMRLAKLSKTVQRGNLEVRSRIRGPDEIGQLGQSFDQMLDYIRKMIHDITLEQAGKRKAELAMLQAQINPHFLFNVLNSIRMKVLKKGDQESAEMISSLSKLLRMTIDRDKAEITLHDEIEVVMDYMKLMNMRQKDKVNLELDVASEALLEKVPRFFLQPVIENAMIHGLQQIPGTIHLRVQGTEQLLTITVRDDGEGMGREVLERLRLSIRSGITGSADGEPRKGFSGIGLPNVFERLKMTYGEACRMDVDSLPGEGTTVTMMIPRRRRSEPNV